MDSSHTGMKCTFYVQKCPEPSIFIRFLIFFYIKVHWILKSFAVRTFASSIFILIIFLLKVWKNWNYFYNNFLGFLRVNLGLGKLYIIFNECLGTHRIQLTCLLFHLVWCKPVGTFNAPWFIFPRKSRNFGQTEIQENEACVRSGHRDWLMDSREGKLHSSPFFLHRSNGPGAILIGAPIFC